MSPQTTQEQQLDNDPSNDTRENEAVPATPPQTIVIPQQGLLKMVAGGGLVGVLAAILYIWQMLQGTAEERAALEYRLKGIEDKLAIIAKASETTTIKLEKIGERPLVREDDFVRWTYELRAANPTMTLPSFSPRER